VTTNIDLTPAYLFTKKLNIVILCLAFIVVLVWNILSWDMLSASAYLIVFSFLLAIICWPQKISMRYFTLVEGELGECIGFNNTVNNSFRSVLYEHKCRITPLGCWLVFTPSGNESKQTYIWYSFGNHITVFVPKYYLSSSEYKGLCRHLIWHSK
jgi:hypothetical protein